IAKQYDEQKSVLATLILDKKQEETNVKNARTDNLRWQQVLTKTQRQIQSIQTKIARFWKTPFLVNLSLDKQSTISLTKYTATLRNQILKYSSQKARAEQSKSEAEQRETALVDHEDCIYCGQPLSSHQAIEYRKHRNTQIKKLIKEIRTAVLQEKKTNTVLDRILKLETQLDHHNSQFTLETSRLDEATSQIQAIETRIFSSTSNFDRISQKIAEVEQNLPKYDRARENQLRDKAKTQNTLWYDTEKTLGPLNLDRQHHERDIDELARNIAFGSEKAEEYNREIRREEWLNAIRRSFKKVLPQLRTNYIRLFEQSINSIYSRLNPAAPLIEINHDYTPTLHYGPYERTSDALSGGERTEIAIAYRIALGNTVSRAQTGQPLELLVLDEPTENLG
ncbi:MAG: hypothetical protein KAR20_27350, partial [Candidatus Heimdallarchaeota archaeon]|nr:hypothetical protein [Candidatus Heimdallarchaeota archaeon]